MGEVGGGKTVEVVMEVVAIDSTLNIPSSMLTFVSLLDKFIVMSGVSTSSLTDLVFETLDSLTKSFSGMVVYCWSPESMFVPVSDKFTVTSAIYVSLKFDLT